MVEGRTKSRAAILNRPSALNALNTAMVGFVLFKWILLIVFVAYKYVKSFVFGAYRYLA